MTGPRLATIRIVTARETNGYTLVLSYSNGAEKPLHGWFPSLTDAQVRAQHYAEQLTVDMGSTITVEPWTDTDTREQ